MLPRFDGKITRLPVLSDANAAKYVLHESTTVKFVLREVTQNAAADPTLQNMLGDPGSKALVTALAFVAGSASLADAQEAMNKVDHCQDLFVTANGRPEEPVLGWVTNPEIAKQVQV